MAISMVQSDSSSPFSIVFSNLCGSHVTHCALNL